MGERCGGRGANDRPVLSKARDWLAKSPTLIDADGSRWGVLLSRCGLVGMYEVEYA